MSLFGYDQKENFNRKSHQIYSKLQKNLKAEKQISLLFSIFIFFKVNHPKKSLLREKTGIINKKNVFSEINYLDILTVLNCYIYKNTV